MVLGGRLYIDMAKDFSDETYFNKTIDDLYNAIIGVIGTPVGTSIYKSAMTSVPSAPGMHPAVFADIS